MANKFCRSEVMVGFNFHVLSLKTNFIQIFYIRAIIWISPALSTSEELVLQDFVNLNEHVVVFARYSITATVAAVCLVC